MKSLSAVSRSRIEPFSPIGSFKVDERDEGGGAQRGGADCAKGIPIVSLFCGAGGLDLGFEQMGFQPILALDNNLAAIESYNDNNGRGVVAKYCNIARMKVDRLVALIERSSPNRPRGIIGGPPCQGFSSGNVVARSADPRNRLPFAYARLIDQLNRLSPVDFFVFENVTGLLRPKHAQRWGEIKKRFEIAGFRLFEEEIDALHFGLAQARRRIFLVGINRALFPSVEFNFPTGRQDTIRTVFDVIHGLPEPTYFARGLAPGEIKHHPNHWTMNPRSSRFSVVQSSKGRSFRQLSWDRPSPTVAYGNREIHVHPSGHRRLSILEAMLLQGFPLSYVLRGTLSEQVTQVSNAVPPPVAEALAFSLKDALYSSLEARLQNDSSTI